MNRRSPPELLDGSLAESAPEARTYLHPGHLVFSATPAILSTVLGSCVAVCLFDEKTGAGGMNHYLLPVCVAAPSPRFGDVANAMLLEAFRRAGISTASLRAKVFGGASMLVGATAGDLARRNVAVALQFLQDQKIPVSSSDVGGSRGRRLFFRNTDGAAWVRQL